jgi:hypothetical protein
MAWPRGFCAFVCRHGSRVFRKTVSGQYLGKAHLGRMVQNYADAGTSAYDLKERASEMLVGDPFMKL